MINVLYDLRNTACERFCCPETKLFYEFVASDTSKAWGDIGEHEYMRLPMFYPAAYKASEKNDDANN